MIRGLGFLLAAAAAIATALSCGAPSPSSPGDASAADDSGVPAPDGGAWPDTSLPGFDGMGCSPTCSADLHDVICGGSVVKTCPSDQGCSGGACIPACDAAVANNASVGCDYYVVVGGPYTESCLAVFVVNNWGSPITVTGDFNGTPLTGLADATRIATGSGPSITYAPLANGQIPAGHVGIAFLAYSPQAPFPCPSGIAPPLNVDPASLAVEQPDGGYVDGGIGGGIGPAIHLSASAPVVAYTVFPYGAGQSAVSYGSLLLPTSGWDTNYVGVTAYPDGIGPTLHLVAMQDDTQVKLTPTADVPAFGALPAIAAHHTGTITLQKGQYAWIRQPAQVLDQTTDYELNGTAIQSNHPIGVFGGNDCMDVPNSAYYCDGEVEQIPPVRALGHEYVGVKYRDRFSDRPETPPWRLVGAVDGTVLTWEPAIPGGAPTSLAAGQMVEFSTGGPFVVRSQDAAHPFFAAQFMTGAGVVSPPQGDDRGDPEFVELVPPEQYLGEYPFFTDPTYPETNLVVTRVKGPSGFADVTLDCLGTIGGWQPVGTSGTYEFARVDLSTGNFSPVGACDNGGHVMKSAGLFGLTVWGWGSAATGAFNTQAVSYAYPAGARVQPINNIVVPVTQ
jgi:hypothetical protein